MLTYATFVQSIANLMPVPSTDPNFLIALPNAIDDAELRLYRELDLIETSTRATALLSAGNRNFNFPAAYSWIVTDELNVVTPSSTTNPEAGTRNPLVPCSEEMLNFLWPSTAGSTVPQYFAMVNQGLCIVGPWPDAAYTVEVVGSIRPQALSSTNITTILSTWFPDLMISAAMVFMSGYMKNYGAMVDDPKQGVSWESHLQAQLRSAATEEGRKKFEMAGWSSKSSAPEATPPRT